MTDLIVERFTTAKFQVQILEDDQITPVDITDALLIFSVWATDCDAWDEALIRLTSADTDEIEITDAVNGTALVALDEDALELGVGEYLWALHHVVADGAALVSGTVNITEDQQQLTFSPSVSLDDIGNRLLVDVQGAGNNDVKTLADVTSDGENLFADYDNFDTATGVAVDVFLADRKRPVNLTGTLTIQK